ncbi:unnamed protein product [Symbiodinium natans]|uniref:RRM domain-containing protein n=1 Tax=Symbiodinium natans TaxID=878477 RepID=A0A812HV37_9DINO|nr:unnamed protein product [Symbiodinium natans]
MSEEQKSLWVGSLPTDVTTEEIREKFSKCGKIDEVFIAPRKSSEQYVYGSLPEGIYTPISVLTQLRVQRGYCEAMGMASPFGLRNLTLGVRSDTVRPPARKEVWSFAGTQALYPRVHSCGYF